MSENKDPKEMQIINAGVDYVFERSDGQECPFCGARMGVGEEANPKALKNHLRSKHPQQCSMSMAQDSLNPVLVNKADESPHAVAGIQLQDEYDRFNALYIPEESRKDAERNGAVLRWAAPDKVRRMLDQGAVIENMPKGSDLRAVQGSTEDNRIRANEMTLLRIPAALAERRQKQKRSRVERQLSASRESYEQQREGIEKLVYDSMKAKGHDSQKAGQVARAVANRAQRDQQGNFTMGDPGAREGITITDQRGSRTL